MQKFSHQTIESRLKISESLKGRIAWNKGKKGVQVAWNKDKSNIYSKEALGKMRFAKLGRKLGSPSELTKHKISLANTGKKLSEKHKNKLSATKKQQIREGLFTMPSRKGIMPWNKGIPHSEKTKQKIRQARLKQVFSRKDSSIELKLQNFLKENEIEFVTHYPILGQPDIFIKPNICIFADGCYWHKCPDCGFGHGRERDVEVTKELQKQNYIVIRLWEHEINNSQKNFSSKITQTIQ